MLDIVSRIISGTLNIVMEEVREDSDLVKDLGCDELDIPSIILGIEEEFKIEIPTEEVIKFKTVKDIADYLDFNVKEYMYKFYTDCGRSGSIDGVFISTKKEVANAIGQDVRFGEILGKHSDVRGKLEDKDFEIIKVSDSTIKEMKEILGKSISGYNPLHYIVHLCSRCGCYYECSYDFYLDNDNNKICEYCATKEEKETLKKID